MGFISWVLVGGLAGWLASLAMGTSKSQGCLMDIVVGIIGAVIGGFIFSLIGGTGVTGFNPWSILVAFIGAVILLAIVRAFRKPSTTT